MKIYGDYTFLLDRLNVRNHSQVKVIEDGTKIVQFADKFLEEQRAASKDEVSISLEGMEYLRDSLSDFGSAGSSAQHTEGYGQPFAAGRGLSLMDGLCRTYILQRLDSEDMNGVSSRLYNGLAVRYDEEMSDRDEGKPVDYAESLAKSYNTMCKNIAEGYENGTREVWTIDKSTGGDFSGVEFEIDGSAVRYRRLSKDEELQKLNKAFERLTQDIAKKIGEPEAAESGGLQKEIKRYLNLIAKEGAMKKEEASDMSSQLTVEIHNHGIQTASGGRPQAQYENYRRISRMTEDVQSLLGNIRA